MEERTAPAESVDRVDLLDILDDLSQDVYDYDLTATVPVVQACPSPLEFAREYVQRNRPCLFRGCIEDWPAMQSWSLTHLCSVMGDAQVDITVTPDGKADSVVRTGEGVECFALPHNERMTLHAFRRLFEETKQGARRCVPSVQFQNSNLTEQFRRVASDVGSELAWASAAFGCQPTATNIWIGDHRYTTSFHKDLYENMYAVVAGSKTFTLLPPVAAYRMHLGSYPAYQHRRREDGEFDLLPLDPPTNVQWCPIDLDAAQLDPAGHNERFPRYCSGPQPLVVTVRSGEVLYIPSCWYHYVQQDELDRDAVIAVNWWYDVPLDLKYAYFSAIEKIAARAGLVGSS